MARLRYNGLTATLGADLTATDTTITFAAALTHAAGTVPTIASGDYIPFSLLDSSGEVVELVNLTAYTSGATTGTIARAQESTTATTHATGAVAAHAPTVVDFTATSSGGSGSSTSAPSTLQTKLARVEKATVAATSTTVLANITGPGVISNIWIAFGCGNGALFYDGILRIYYDGETTPSCEVPLANWTAGVYASVGSARYACNRIQYEGKVNTQFGVSIGYEIPFGTSVKIEYYNPSTDTGTIYGQVFYRDTEARNYRLKAKSISYLNRVTNLAANATLNLLSLPAGKAGWLVFSSIFGDGVSNRTWMERNIQIKVNGESTPSIETTGLEDWFLGSFYFQDRQQYATPTTMVGINESAQFRTHAAVDLLQAFGGIRFNSGVDVTLATEANCTTAADICYTTAWYEEV